MHVEPLQPFGGGLLEVYHQTPSFGRAAVSAALQRMTWQSRDHFRFP